MNKSIQLTTFLKEYEEYVTTILDPTRIELKKVLKQWKFPGYWGKFSDDHTHLPSPSPVQRITSRIKRPESVVDKILRKPENYPDHLSSNSFPKIHDLLGARVIIYFISNFPIVDRELRSMEELEISKDFPPIAYLSEDTTKRLSLVDLNRQDKESGYASIHYIVRLTESSVPHPNRPWVELQVRTLAEDLWGEIEHILGYKPDKRTSFAVKKQFQMLSNQLRNIDDHFNFLYEELSRFQEEVRYEDTDPLNAENIPQVLSKMGLGCSQQEIDGILKLLVSRGLNSVVDLFKVATPSRLEVIRNTYRKELGRAPIDFEVIANLATLKNAQNGEEEEISLVKAQISYLDAWDTLKKSFK